MRLLHVQTFKLHTFHDDDIPPYAILSHTWLPDDQEVTFASMYNQLLGWRNVQGSKKIDFLCTQAASDGLDWAWMDTCCIDKTNSVELSEAINSMFKWYQRAQICYVYLVDVQEQHGVSLLQSRWWSRAWTLQELVAPAKVNFYDANWAFQGTKASLAKKISSRSGVDRETLKDASKMNLKSVACRMSWAAQRSATRAEDVAYSLLGIFGVSLDMQYGEGSRAFMRLQKKILESTNDQTLFAWGFTPHILDEAIERRRIQRKEESNAAHGEDESDSDLEFNTDKGLPWHPFGMFAESPRRFAGCGDIIFHHLHTFDSAVSETNGALRMELLTAPLSKKLVRGLGIRRNPKPFPIALLPCGSRGAPNCMIGIFLEQWTPGRFRRLEAVKDVFTFLVDCGDLARTDRNFVWIDDAAWIERHLHGTNEAHHFHKSVRLDVDLPSEEYTVSLVTQAWTFDQANRTLHRHHNMKDRRRHLEVALERHKTSDYLVLVLEFSNRGDPDPGDDGRLGNKVCIFKKTSLDEGPWIENGYGGLLYGTHVGRRASLEGIHVELKTHQVFNHLISTLAISGQPIEQSMVQSALSPVSPGYPFSPVWT
jgi:hypothetical protein